ncbi:MAG TPA: hypothetical protein VFW71_01225, partial [Actinomycetota bacterium]|nr:hypothetical protein [Actinomycetota bacterium]
MTYDDESHHADERPPFGGARFITQFNDGPELEDEEEPEEEEEEVAPLTVLVVDRKGTFSHDIERAARQQSPEPKVVLVDHPTQVVEQVVAEAPDVVLVSPEEMTTTGLRRLAQVHRVAPRCV